MKRFALMIGFSFVSLCLGGVMRADAGPQATSQPLAKSGSKASQAASSLCKKGETVFFSCKVQGKKKWVSLCGVLREGGKSAYLQYRFGRAGKVELTYPTQKVHPKGIFSFGMAHPHPRITSMELNFLDKGGYSYAVSYTFFHGEENAGVMIQKKGWRKHISLKCEMPLQIKGFSQIERWTKR